MQAGTGSWRPGNGRCMKTFYAYAGTAPTHPSAPRRPTRRTGKCPPGETRLSTGSGVGGSAAEARTAPASLAPPPGLGSGRGWVGAELRSAPHRESGTWQWRSRGRINCAVGVEPSRCVQTGPTSHRPGVRLRPVCLTGELTPRPLIVPLSAAGIGACFPDTGRTYAPDLSCCSARSPASREPDDQPVRRPREHPLLSQ